MNIAIIVEGKTEKAFKPHLQNFLQSRLHGRMPTLDYVTQNGRIPKGDKLKRIVENLLSDRHRGPADAVVALTDVYTGTSPPDFKDAADARQLMQQWVGAGYPFCPHAAQYEFEAWLLPYWKKIQRLADSRRKAPGRHPERINHGKPPSRHLKEAFSTGRTRQAYKKIIHADKILHGEDLLVSANACPELKSFLNTILTLCGGATIP